MNHAVTRLSRPLSTLASILFLMMVLAGSALAADNAGWRLVSDKNGIQVYMKHNDEARIKTFRGITRLKIDRLAPMSGVLNDTPNIPRWMYFISKVNEIRRSDYLNREYQFLTSLPWPLQDREATVQLLVRQDPQTHGVTVHVINQPNLLPLNPAYVRMPELQGRFAFVPTGNPREVEVTYELIMDPGGYIPAWIANIVLKDVPYFTLERFRRTVTRPEYQNWKEPMLVLPW